MREEKSSLVFSSLITHHSSRFYEHSFRQTREHRRRGAYAARAGGRAAGRAGGENFVGGRAARGRNFEGQPSLRNPHRSGHEGIEALAVVWGDAAGNASAVAAVTRLTLRPFHRFPRFT